MSLEIHFSTNFYKKVKFFSISTVGGGERTIHHVSLYKRSRKENSIVVLDEDDSGDEKSKIYKEYFGDAKVFGGIDSLHKWQLRWLLRNCHLRDICLHVKYTINMLNKQGKSTEDLDHIAGIIDEMIYESKENRCYKKDIYSFYDRICEASPNPNRDEITMYKYQSNRKVETERKFIYVEKRGGSLQLPNV